MTGLPHIPLEHRRTPFDASGFRGIVGERVEIHLPDSLRVARLPKSVRLESPDATYRLDVVAAAGNVLVLERELQLLPLEVPRERCEALRKFFAKVSDAERCLIVLHGSLREPSPQASADLGSGSKDALSDR